jgi:hypothetical protein
MIIIIIRHECKGVTVWQLEPVRKRKGKERVLVCEHNHSMMKPTKYCKGEEEGGIKRIQ